MIPDKRLVWHPRRDDEFVVGGGTQITLYGLGKEFPEIRQLASRNDLHHMRGRYCYFLYYNIIILIYQTVFCVVSGLPVRRPRRSWFNHRTRRSYPPQSLSSRSRSCLRLIYRPIRPTYSTQLQSMQRSRFLNRRSKLSRSRSRQSPWRSQFGHLGFDHRETLPSNSGRYVAPGSTFTVRRSHSPLYRTPTLLPRRHSHPPTTRCGRSRICSGIHSRHNPSVTSRDLKQALSIFRSEGTHFRFRFASEHTTRCEWDGPFLAVHDVQHEFRKRRAARKLEYGHERKRVYQWERNNREYNSSFLLPDPLVLHYRRHDDGDDVPKRIQSISPRIPVSIFASPPNRY